MWGGSLELHVNDILRYNCSDEGDRERMERQTSIQSIEPGPRNCQSSALSTKPLFWTEVCLPILPYVLKTSICNYG